MFKRRIKRFAKHRSGRIEMLFSIDHSLKVKSLNIVRSMGRCFRDLWFWICPNQLGNALHLLWSRANISLNPLAEVLWGRTFKFGNNSLSAYLTLHEHDEFSAI